MPSRVSRALSLALVVFLFLTFIPRHAFGEEGMFLPDAIGTLPLDKLARRGLKLTATDLYDPNGVSIKDAIVIVDGGTGEFISPEGLLLTNHHVAFDALVAAATPAKDYAAKGYLAASRAEELPAKDYTVTITEGLKDVTSEVMSGVTDAMSPMDRNRAIQTKIRTMEAAADEDQGRLVRVLPMNEGLSYYRFDYFVLRDVRVVYAPPKNIGFFGGDDDNFEWPRHCGDFTFMRAYTGPDGKPADYSPQNVPFKPKKFLSISMGGVKEGDLMLVMGYPGSTRRYRESYSVAYNQDIVQPFLVDLYRNQVQILQDAGKNDPELRIKLQSDIANYNNTLKNYEGSTIAMRRADIVGQKRTQEAAFTRWLDGSPARKAKYGDALPSIGKAYQELMLVSPQRDLLVQQIFSASDLLGIAFFAQQIAVEKEKPEAERNPALVGPGVERARARIAPTLAARNPTVERAQLTYMLRKADELPPGQKIEALEKRFGSLKGEARRRAEDDFARQVVDSKRFATADALTGLFDISAAQMRELHEPLVELAVELGQEVARIQVRTQKFNNEVTRWRPVLLEGMSEMRALKPYPDANRTLRFTYGEVKGYAPREAITYAPFTTLSGVLEKDTGSEPFDVPEKLKQLYRAHDFGTYAQTDGRDVPVNFLSTTDIIGGNSGSPILNGRGEQVGIVFDGNYEGLGNDFFYNEAKGRTISVDIRYVLFIADKFGGAGYLLKELDLKNTPTMRGRGAAATRR
jgi:hypothetical protein